MDHSNLSKAEQIVLGSATSQPPKAKYVPTPEHMEKLRLAREKYQADVKAGLIKPAVRTPKVTVIEAPKFDTVNTGLDLHQPVTFVNTKTRWELLVKGGNFNSDPLPFLYVTRTITNTPDGTYYEVENPAGDFLNESGKWVSTTKKAAPRFASLVKVRAVTQSMNIILPELS